MAEKLVIEIFKQKTVEQFAKCISDPASKLESGSVAAATAMLSASLLCRAVELTTAGKEADEPLAYLVRNSATMRDYMVHLVDEDVKSRGPLRRALKEGDAQKIEAAYQPAACISAEVIGMMLHELELLGTLVELCPPEVKHLCMESTELALSAVRTARWYILSLCTHSTDDTYTFVTRRENEILLAQAEELAQKIRSKMN